MLLIVVKQICVYINKIIGFPMAMMLSQNIIFQSGFNSHCRRIEKCLQVRIKFINCCQFVELSIWNPICRISNIAITFIAMVVSHVPKMPLLFTAGNRNVFARVQIIHELIRCFGRQRHSITSSQIFSRICPASYRIEMMSDDALIFTSAGYPARRTGSGDRCRAGARRSAGNSARTAAPASDSWR